MMSGGPVIAMIAGEASGDLQGARLATRIREMVPSARIWGIGGRRMREAGADLMHDSSSWSAIGFAESLKLVPGLIRIQSRLVRRIEADPPDLLVLIDFGAFNVRLARGVRGLGIKVLYYFPPGSWKRGSTYEKLQGLVDAVVTPFPWSAETLRRKGFRAEFFGHPLLDSAKPSLTEAEFRGGFGFDGSAGIAALLPGSRDHEVAHNLPAMIASAAGLSRPRPDLQYAVPIAPTVDIRALADGLQGMSWLDVRLDGRQEASTGRVRSRIAGSVKSLMRRDGIAEPPGPVTVNLLSGMSREVLAYSRAAVVCSGTATLEAAVLGCPMVVVYRGSRLMQLEYRLMGGGIGFFGMPNIIADEEICPELLQDDASPSRIAALLEPLLDETAERRRMLERLAETVSVLGSPGAVDKTASLALDLIGRGG